MLKTDIDARYEEAQSSIQVDINELQRFKSEMIAIAIKNRSSTDELNEAIFFVAKEIATLEILWAGNKFWYEDMVPVHEMLKDTENAYNYMQSDLETDISVLQRMQEDVTLMAGRLPHNEGISASIDVITQKIAILQNQRDKNKAYHDGITPDKPDPLP